MDLFLASCQGIGLALAAGAVAGALGGAAGGDDGWSVPAAMLLGLGAGGGGLLFGASLTTEDHPAWPGWPVGALIAFLAFAVARDVVRGAATRAEGAPPGALALYVIVAAAILSILSLLLPPLGLIALLGLVWLAIARRRRATRKYEGLRVLR